MKTKSPTHLLLRFSDSILKDKDTITEHNQVIQRSGAVWFGKMGAPVAQHQVDVMMQQIEDGIPAYVFLVKGNRRKSTAYRGKILSLSRIKPENQDMHIPQYYFDLDLIKYMRFWVKLTEIISIDLAELNKLHVASSVLPLPETLVKSSTGHFILKEDDLSF